MTYKTRKAGKFFQKEGVLHVDKQEEVQSPENEVPACSVPESGKTPDNQKVDGTSAGTFPVSAEWNIDIITEESSEGNMPSVPEFFNGTGDVRVIKVFIVVKTNHKSHTDCHVGIGGKIKINLQCIEQHTNPQTGCRNLGNVTCKCRNQSICNRCTTVCQNCFFGKTDGKTLDTLV